MLSFFKKNKKTIIFASFFVLFLLVNIGLAAQSETEPASKISIFISNLLGGFIKTAALWFVGLANWIFSTVFSYTVLNFAALFRGEAFVINFEPGIKTAWTLGRDIANLIIVSMFIFSAVATILRITSYELKVWILKVIITALLINFSLFFVKFSIDISNAVAIQLYNIPAGGEANTNDILTNFALKVTKYNSWFKFTPNINTDPWYNLLVTIFIAFAEIALAAVLVYGTVVMLGRFVGLLFVMAMSAIGFVMYVMPGKGIEYFKKWANYLFRYTIFAPLFVFMMSITAVIFGNASKTLKPENTAAALAKASFVSGSNSDISVMGPIIYIASVIGALYAAIKISDSLSIVGTNAGKWLAARTFSSGSTPLRWFARPVTGLAYRAAYWSPLRNTALTSTLREVHEGTRRPMGTLLSDKMLNVKGISEEEKIKNAKFAESIKLAAWPRKKDKEEDKQEKVQQSSTYSKPREQAAKEKASESSESKTTINVKADATAAGAGGAAHGESDETTMRKEGSKAEKVAEQAAKEAAQEAQDEYMVDTEKFMNDAREKLTKAGLLKHLPEFREVIDLKANRPDLLLSQLRTHFNNFRRNAFDRNGNVIDEEAHKLSQVYGELINDFETKYIKRKGVDKVSPSFTSKDTRGTSSSSNVGEASSTTGQTEALSSETTNAKEVRKQGLLSKAWKFTKKATKAAAADVVEDVTGYKPEFDGEKKSYRERLHEEHEKFAGISKDDLEAKKLLKMLKNLESKEDDKKT